MSIEDFIKELEMSIEAAGAGLLKPETRFRELPWWDSLAVLSTLATFDACFGKQIGAADLQACETIADIYRLSAR